MTGPLSHVLAVLGACIAVSASFAQTTPHGAFKAKVDYVKSVKAAAGPPNVLPSFSSPARVKNITFSNPRASEFYVDGTSIPLVDFDAGPSWAGLLPISNATNETRKLFFWFFPPGPQGSLDDLIFWTNGGPGCSSLDGFLEENGPISWQKGTAKPVPNPLSWTNLSGVLWVEQPVGTGFTQGIPNITNEDELAAQLAGFLQQFLEVFSELKGKKFYTTGESYAGAYVPYIANYLYEHPGLVDLDLQGFWIGDAVISDIDTIQSALPTANFVHSYQNVFAFNQSFLNFLDAKSKRCGYNDYFEKHVTYPPEGKLPYPSGFFNFEQCDTWTDVFEAAFIINPAFNVYHIFDTPPVLWDVLGFPGSFFEAQTLPLYFDRTDVKELLHVPTTINWTVCSNNPVFVNDTDTSPPSAWTVLPNVIEKSKRSVISHGLADFLLIAEGTRVAIQNMTWGGAQGFHTPIRTESFKLDGVGVVGNTHTERGLTYYEMLLAGHEVPGYTPAAAFRSMQFLMGFKPNPSD